MPFTITHSRDGTPAFNQPLPGRFLHRPTRQPELSFSSAAHLVGYYAKEMESIAER